MKFLIELITGIIKNVYIKPNGKISWFYVVGTILLIICLTSNA